MSTPSQSGHFAGRPACQSSAVANAYVSGNSTRLTWFHDPPSRGSWNMALDEALLHRTVEERLPTLRFYGWDQPTISLGYFQRNEDRALHPPSRQCPVVRRATGGGAIVHDHELTYSCTLPAGHPLARRAGDLYYAMHDSLVVVLAQFGLAAHHHSCDQDRRSSTVMDTPGGFGCGANNQVAQLAANGLNREQFLCFERRTAGDIILEGHKVVGSAQRRYRGAVLQHGSILLAQSKYAATLPGICDLGGARLDTLDFAERMRNALSVRLEFDLAYELPSTETMERAAHIEAAKFATESWQRLR